MTEGEKIAGSAPPTSSLTVEVDGQPLPMLPFVEEITENVIIGLMKSLRGYTETAEIKITLKQQP